MPRHFTLGIATVLLLSLATTASAADRSGKRHVARRSHGYGFLPGYRPPEKLERERYEDDAPHYYWYGGRYYFGGAHFYRGRWNGGSFGPCWTYTPIGLMWTCG